MNPLDAARRLKHQGLLARKAFSADGRLRARWRRAGVKMHPSAYASSTCVIAAGAVIGPGCFLNDGVKLDALVELGAQVDIGPRAYLCTDSHEFGDRSRRAGANLKGPVKIGDGCWIGANATILPGVTVAPGCVIAAGAVVSKSTAPDGLYVGVPARRVRDLS